MWQTSTVSQDIVTGRAMVHSIGDDRLNKDSGNRK